MSTSSRTPHHRTPAGMHHRFRPRAPVNAIWYRRADVGIGPYRVHTMIRTPNEMGYLGERESRRPPPREGWGRRPSGLRPGDCARCDGRLGTMGNFAPCAARVFRWLRPAGVSPAAAGDQGRCLWKPRFFEKNRVKLFNFCSWNRHTGTKPGPAALSASPGHVMIAMLRTGGRRSDTPAAGYNCPAGRTYRQKFRS